MADKFDPYREALVMEIETVWPPDLAELSPQELAALEEQLHAAPQSCAQLEYLRTHTGFCRKITVTAEDRARLGR